MLEQTAKRLEVREQAGVCRGRNHSWSDSTAIGGMRVREAVGGFSSFQLETCIGGKTQVNSQL
jgi:hypothetical protein